MWRAFQTAAASRVGEMTSAGAPTVARWALTAASTAPPRSPRAAGQSPPVVQSPVAGAEAGGTASATAAASTGAARAAVLRRGVRTRVPSERVLDPMFPRPGDARQTPTSNAAA